MKNLRLYYKKETPFTGEDISKFDMSTTMDFEKINSPEKLDGWEAYSLPLGNGYMGVNVFGRVASERLQITENSLSNPACAGCTGGLNNFLELYLDFPHTFEKSSNYERDLVLNTATAHVSYEYDGILYNREYFTNYPDNVFVSHITASEPASVSFRVRPVIPYICESLFEEGDGMGKSGTVTASGDTITAEGIMEYYQIKYEAQIKVITSGGEIISNSDSIEIKNADEVTILTVVGTNYKSEERVFLEEDPKKKLEPYPHPHERVSEILKNAASKGYEKLKETHQKDFFDMFGRVEFEICSEDGVIPTDELLVGYKKGNKNLYLEELYFQYGRYLLMSSSRPGTYPANLQGTWNKYESSPWTCGYWHNVNVQMNYWPAFNTNLIECFEPYVKYCDSYMKLARNIADNYVKEAFPEKFEEDGGNGWRIGTAAFLYTLFEDAVFGGHSGPGTVAFTSKLFWEYFDFTQDKEILKNISYPVLEGASKFLSKVLEPNGDLYLTKYSASPEQMHEGKAYQTTGCAFDQQMIYENHSDTLKSAEILGIENDTVNIIREQIDKLEPVIIGKSGQVKEYREENEYGDIGEYHHRHTSQLMGLYPGTSINSNTPDYLKAAEVTLNLRGDHSTGWSTAYKLNLWARIKNGKRAYMLFNMLLERCTLPNLWDYHPPFQIDGNFGGTAGIAEMLIQSHEGYIDIIPSIPDEWKNGHFKGLTARGAFEVGARWKDGNVTEISVTSKAGNICRIKGKFVVSDTVYHQEDGFTVFETETGKTYNLTV